MTQKYVDYARVALDLEINSIKNLHQTINTESFSKACDLLLNITGKVIVIGVGKSGHIGAKFSASLSSTGTPSIFIHGCEATHGDLGAIQTSDIVVFISNSGESAEFKSINSFLQAHKIKIIALTSNLTSYLAKSADIVLNIAALEEACPHNLAPTSSTTNTLVLCDLMIVALLRTREFAAEQFATFHPQGRLGKRLLMTVDEVMHTDIPIVNSNETLVNLIVEMTNKKLGIVLIGDHNQLQGVFTDGDLRRLIEQQKNIYALNIDQLINRQFKFVESQSNAYQALQLMQYYKISSLPVIDKGKVIGLVNLYDLLNAGL